jgi:hypothetical protein
MAGGNKMQTQANDRSPSELVAIAKAAHAIGDRELERAAKRELAEQHGIDIKFRRRPIKAEAAP